MSAIEQKARQMLVEKYRERGQERYAQMLEQDDAIAVEADKSAIAAIIAALMPPEGYVLVDSKLLDSVRVARLVILQKQAASEEEDEPSDAAMWGDCAADLEAIAPKSIIAARPEIDP